MNRKIVKLLFLTFILFSFNAQGQIVKYWVQFSDKNNSPFLLDHPEDFLSQKSLQRRIKQGIQIKWDDLPVNPSYLTDVQSKGVRTLNASKWLNGVSIETDDTIKIVAIKTLPFVSSVKTIFGNSGMVDKVDFKYKKESFIPYENNQRERFNKTTTEYNYGPSFNQIKMISGDFLHQDGFSGQGMVIAVLDAGFYKVNTLAFDSIRANNQILGTWDFVTGDTNVYEDDQHGMYALSTIAAYLPGKLVGTAPKAEFWLLRSEDAPTESIIEEYNWATAAEFADSAGADIISSSVGYNTFTNSKQNHTFADMDGNTTPITIAADKAASMGILVVESAGNEGGGSWHQIIAPADGDSVLAVGAVDANKIRAGFSSVGPSSVGKVKPNIVAQGSGVVLASSGGETMTGNGTSFSCPIISGMAACLWQANPNFSNMDILRAIEKSSSHYFSPDSLTGYGIPNFMLANKMLTSDTQTYKKEVPYLFPNPFYDNLKLKFFPEASGLIYAEVNDVVGKRLLVFQKEVFAGSINTVLLYELDQLNTGVYLIKLSTLNKSFTTKIVKF